MNHKSVLLWMTVINYAVLIIWFLALIFARDAIYRMHAKWFKLSVESFDAINYGGMAVYKIGILLLNVAPLIALLITGQ